MGDASSINVYLESVFQLSSEGCVVHAGRSSLRKISRKADVVYRVSKEEQLGEFEYLGDARWLVEPYEEGFEPGLTFDVIGNPIVYSESRYTDGIIAKGELLAKA